MRRRVTTGDPTDLHQPWGANSIMRSNKGASRGVAIRPVVFSAGTAGELQALFRRTK